MSARFGAFGAVGCGDAVNGPLRRAVELSLISVGWNTFVGFAAVGTALAMGSLSLIGFGVNAVVDSSVSVLLIRRFRAEERGHDERAARAEEGAERVAGIAFLLIAAYLTAQAVRALIHGTGHSASAFAIVEAVASLLVLPLLGRAKLRVAATLGSRALRADSMLTLFGAALAAVACAALILQRVEGWWWADAVGALVIAALLLSEASRTLGGLRRARSDIGASCVCDRNVQAGRFAGEPRIAIWMACADEMLAFAASRTDELAAVGYGPRPRRKVAVLACMDARIDLFSMLGLARGDAHIIRNAGGLVTDDALRSLSVSQRLLGTEEIVVVMHERCGLQGASEDRFVQELAVDGAAPAWRIGAFDDLEATLRAGLACLRAAQELLMRHQIRGFIFDPDSGALREVVEPAKEDEAPIDLLRLLVQARPHCERSCSVPRWGLARSAS